MVEVGMFLIAAGAVSLILYGLVVAWLGRRKRREREQFRRFVRTELNDGGNEPHNDWVKPRD